MKVLLPGIAASQLTLRDANENDLAIFFEQQGDPDARWMAAFTSKDPTNCEAFTTLWLRLLADPSIHIQAIVVDHEVVGSLMGYEASGRSEISYWLGQAHWGKGIATQALSTFLLERNDTRPLYARAAKDNAASLRVLEKCGFVVISEGRGFANARNEEIDELLLKRSLPRGNVAKH